MTNNQTVHPKYRPDIDGLRAIAVLSVVIYHAFPSYLTGGYAGVDVFFVISGFLISTILFQSIDSGTFSLIDFYSRRTRRIFPALALTLLTVLLFGWFCLLPDELKQLGKHTASSAGFIQNFTLWKESGYFDNTSETKPLLHIWSLGIEEQFYFIWPILLWGAGKISGARYKKLFYFFATFLVFAISFTLNIILVKENPTKTFYLPQYRFWEMALGGILSWAVLYKPTISISFSEIPESAYLLKLTNKWIKDGLAILGMVILLAVFTNFNKETIFPGVNALLPVLATVFIILAGPQSLLNKKILSHKILVWLGLISFPLYLWHWPILSFGQIIYGELPPREFRILAVFVSILLSWLTVRFIEKPFRFGSKATNKKVLFLITLVALIAGAGFATKKLDGFPNRGKLKIQRKGLEDTIGMSDKWYHGKGDWLFLGNAYDKTVSKNKLSITPSEAEITNIREAFSNLAKTGNTYGVKVALIVGANKSSVYPEYLPDELVPSPKKYSEYFLERLRNIPNLQVYNSTTDLLTAKKNSELLYSRTDTHWNNKGAFVAFTGFAKLFQLPIPQIKFQQSEIHPGDLVEISGLKEIPILKGDSWDIIWETKPSLTIKEIPDEPETPAGKPIVVFNQNALTDKKVWVIGDSFTTALKQYFNATFKEIHYIGHWNPKLEELPLRLVKASIRPDLIIVVRVERSF